MSDRNRPAPDLPGRATPGQRSEILIADIQPMQLPGKRVISIEPAQQKLSLQAFHMQTMQAECNASPQRFENCFLCCPQFKKRSAAFLDRSRSQNRQLVLTEIMFGNIQRARAIALTFDIDTGSKMLRDGYQRVVAAVRPVQSQYGVVRRCELRSAEFAVNQRHVIAGYSEVCAEDAP